MLSFEDDRAGGDAEPRLRRPGARPRRGGAARVRSGRAAGDDPAARAGAARTSCSRPRSSRSAAMRPFQHTIPLDEARAILEAAARPIDPRRARARWRDLAGRVLAEDVIADADVPPFARAMMDGYAVRAADTTGASPRGAGRAAASSAGSSPARCSPARVGRRSCVEIATGAPLPDGADAVVMVEETAPGARWTRRRSRRPRPPASTSGAPGADIARGTTVLRSGDLLWPGRLGAAGGARPHRRRSWSPGRGSRSSPPATRWCAPGAAARPRPDLRHQRLTLAAIVAAHGGVPVPIAAGRRHDRGARPGARPGARLRRHRLLGRQLGGRSRSRARRAAAPRRGRLPRHRHASGQADGVRPRRHGAGLRHARQSDVVPDQRLRPAGAVPATRGPAAAASAARGAGVADAAGRRRAPAGTSSTRCGWSNSGAEPAFKASADITSMANADGYIEIAADVTAVEAGDRGRRRAVRLTAIALRS